MQRTVRIAVTHNEGDTVWNSFMRCRLLNYLVHGTLPQFICIFLSLSQICLYFFAFSSIRICYSYDFWHRIISENLVWYWFINPFLGSSCFLSSFEWKNECVYVFGGPYLSFLVSFGVNRYLSGGLYLFSFSIVWGKSLCFRWSVPSFLIVSSAIVLFFSYLFCYFVIWLYLIKIYLSIKK